MLQLLHDFSLTLNSQCALNFPSLEMVLEIRLILGSCLAYFDDDFATTLPLCFVDSLLGLDFLFFKVVLVLPFSLLANSHGVDTSESTTFLKTACGVV